MFFKYNSCFCHELHFWRWKFQSQTAIKILPQISRLDHARSATSYTICTQQASELAQCIVQSLLRDWRREKQTILLGIEPTTLRSTSEVWCCTWRTTLLASFFRLSSTLVKWLSSWTYAQVPSGRFLVSGLLQTTPCAPYPSKRQRSTAWITALRYQCKLKWDQVMGLALSQCQGWCLLPSVLVRHQYWPLRMDSIEQLQLFGKVWSIDTMIHLITS